VNVLDHERPYPPPLPINENHLLHTPTPPSLASRSSFAEDHSLQDITSTLLSLIPHSPVEE